MLKTTSRDRTSVAAGTAQLTDLQAVDSGCGRRLVVTIVTSTVRVVVHDESVPRRSRPGRRMVKMW